MQPWRVSVLYWRMKRPCGIKIDRFPILRFLNAADGHTIYSVPCAEYPGMMKVSCEAVNCLHPLFFQMTPDSDYILDTHPRFKNIAIGAGFSGKEPFN